MVNINVFLEDVRIYKLWREKQLDGLLTDVDKRLKTYVIAKYFLICWEQMAYPYMLRSS